MPDASLKTVGDLKKSGARVVSVKEEMRLNLIARMKEGKSLFPGIIGYEKTVIPAIQNALLARHDFILLGLRGQGKSRILRALVDLLDEVVPVVPGCEINDHPLAPVCKKCRRTVNDETPLGWLRREDRYREKLATPDVTMADLIGDIDPIKAANERRSLSDEEVIHYGILPRTHRGIFAINELPDLQTRIQVGLLNIMEERDVQIRGFPIRLALDVCIVYTANPEDYTNRGTIITPLKDRIDSQILTHYPASIEEAMSITAQEAWIKRGDVCEVRVPRLVSEIIEEMGFQARKSEFVDQNSGVSARMSISAMENVVSNCERRAIKSGEKRAVPRICDLYAAVPAIAGKIELVYEGEREGVVAVARRILGQSVQAAFKRSFPDAFGSKPVDPRPVKQKSARPGPGTKDAPLDETVYKPVLDWFARGSRVEITDSMSTADYVRVLDQVPGLREIAERSLKPSAEELPLAMEFVLEGLHQNSLIAREDLEGAVSYKDMLKTMFESMGTSRGEE
jgi:magnesium chelatase subunit I